jgi:predicted MFS family arabinose efflux permease
MHPHSEDSTTTVYRTDNTLIIILAVTVFFVGATEFMLSSILTPLAGAFHTSAVGSTWLISTYAFSYALAAPVFEYFSDRVDRSMVLLVALIVFAMISDVVPYARQASAMGIVMLGMTAGIAFGPAFAGLLKFPNRSPTTRTSGQGGLVQKMADLTTVDRQRRIERYRCSGISIIWCGVATALWFRSRRGGLDTHRLRLGGIANTELYPICQIRGMKAVHGGQVLAGTINVSAANGGIALGAAPR